MHGKLLVVRPCCVLPISPASEAAAHLDGQRRAKTLAVQDLVVSHCLSPYEGCNTGSQGSSSWASKWRTSASASMRYCLGRCG